jgi:ABC-type branched-subunit amino acid transport system ATPase component/branched-subunit amino acid ABC-type transport system permease component
VTEVFRFALLGLGAGGLYALAAIGLVLVFRGSGVVNFAQGAMGMVAAYVYYQLHVTEGAPVAVAVIVGLLASALLGALYYGVFMRRMTGASQLAKIVSTLALLVVLEAVTTLHYGFLPKVVASILPTSTMNIFGAVVDVDRIWIFFIVLVLTVVLWAVYKYTTFGVATTAVAENPRVAASLAVSPNLVATINWAVGAALGGLSAILLAPITGLSVESLTGVVIPVLAAAVIGRFRSFPLTMLTGLAIGIAQSEVTRYVSTPGAATAVPFLLVTVVLLVRSRATISREEHFGRMPSLGTGRVPPFLVGAGVVVALLCNWFFFPEAWVAALQIQLIATVILLSFVVITGYAGQLSLVQFGLAGIGSLVAGWLYSSHGWDFPLAMLAGMLAVIPVGLVVGLAGVRTRGVNLGIVTLGLGVTLEAGVFGNSKYVGGLSGYTANNPTFFGIQVSGLFDPKRYTTLALILLLLLSLAVANLRRSRVGRRLIAVRTNERAASALGVSVVGAKLYAFVLSGMIAAVGGILLTFRSPALDYSGFVSVASITYLQGAVLGGVGHLGGPLLGSSVQPDTLGQQIFSFLGSNVATYLAIASGVGVLFLLTFFPDGLVEMTRQQNAWWLERVRARLPRRPPADPLAGVAELDERVPPKTLSIEGLVVRFGGTTALDGLSVDVHPGEVVGLIGPNGAGKSTAIDAVTGFVSPAEGTISLDGRTLNAWSSMRRARAGIGRSFQSLELFDDLTVLENVQAASDGRDLMGYVTNLFWPGRQRLTPRARAALRDFGLLDELHTETRQLSYAQRRLLAVARAVAGGHSILLLDEPAAGLSEVAAFQLSDAIRNLAASSGVGVLLIEHNVDMVLRTCDRVYALNFGVVIGHGTPNEIRTNPAVIDAYLGTSRFKDDISPDGEDQAPSGMASPAATKPAAGR